MRLVARRSVMANNLIATGCDVGLLELYKLPRLTSIVENTYQSSGLVLVKLSNAMTHTTWVFDVLDLQSKSYCITLSIHSTSCVCFKFSARHLSSQGLKKNNATSTMRTWNIVMFSQFANGWSVIWFIERGAMQKTKCHRLQWDSWWLISVHCSGPFP